MYHNSSVIDKLNRAVSLMRRRLLVVLSVRFFCLSGAATLFSAGAVLVVLQATRILTPLWAVSLPAAALLLAAAAAWLLARRQLPSRAQLVTLLDSRCPEGGGLVCALQELPIGDWERRIQLPELPRISCELGRRVAVLLLAFAFVGASFMTPSLQREEVTVTRLDVTAEVDRAREQLELLNDEQLIPELEKDELLEELSQLEENALGLDPVKSFEALDHLSRTLQNQLMNAELRTMNAQNQLEMVEQLTELVEAAAASMPEEELGEALSELDQLMEKLREKEPLLDRKGGGSGDGSFAESGTAGMKEQNALTQQELENLQQKLQEQLAKNGGSQKGNGQKGAGKAGRGNQASMEKLQQFLAANGMAKRQSGMNSKLNTMCQGMMPGNGGIGKGPGAAPLTFERRDLSGDNHFEELMLPPGALDWRDSVVVGVTAAEAKANEDSAPAGHGALEGVAAGVRERRGQTLQPRHRAAVGNYFERQTDKE